MVMMIMLLPQIFYTDHIRVLLGTVYKQCVCYQ